MQLNKDAAPTVAAVEAQLARIFASRAFARAGRLQAFLGFVVRQHLLGDGSSLKEYLIGIEVFGKPTDFDPAGDSTVRVRANRLRSSLAAYYASEGINDDILIALPKGHYVPEIVLRLSSGPVPRPSRRKRTLAAFATALVVAILLIALRGQRIVPTAPSGRVLARATSEGGRLRQIALAGEPNFLAISPSDDKILAITNYGRVLSIIPTTDGSVKTVKLPRQGGALAVSADGKLYIASQIEGIMVFDIARAQIVNTLPTGGAVLDIAIGPGGNKLFLAMGQLGLKRLSLDTGALTSIRVPTCPVSLAMDHQGNRLYVAYQCGGPSGRKGHDSLEIFNARTEKSLGIVTGPPMVGARPNISPDDQLAILEGQDACSNVDYDHSGCPSVPSQVFHLLRASDRQVLRTFGYPFGSGPKYFVDNSRFLVLGNSLSVVDAASSALLERLDLGQNTAESAVFSHDGRRLWIGVSGKPGLLEFETGPALCKEQEPGPTMFFPADGSFADAYGATVLSGHGHVAFTPGKRGQAFLFDGHSYLSTDSTGYYKIFRHDFSIAMYVKFATTDGEAALIDWTRAEPQIGIRLMKSGNNHFVFQTWPGGDPLTSVSSVVPKMWYYVAVTKADGLLTLSVNGKAETSGKPPAHFPAYADPLSLGANESGRATLHGSLDEIAFYNRGLNAGEIRSVYQTGVTGACAN